MLECKIDRGHTELTVNGPLLAVMAESGMLLSAIYNSIKRTNDSAAAMYRRALRALMTDDSPVWQPNSPSAEQFTTVIDVEELLRQMKEDKT